MSYRRVDQRFWNDEKVEALPPLSKLAVMYFLTGPDSRPLPGLQRLDVMRFARSVGADSDVQARAIIRPVEEAGIAKVDWVRGFVWLPNAIRYNLPASSKTIKGWIHDLRNLPECPLFWEAVGSIAEVLMSMKGPKAWGAFENVFRSACGRGLTDLPSRPTGMGHGMGHGMGAPEGGIGSPHAMQGSGSGSGSGKEERSAYARPLTRTGDGSDDHRLDVDDDVAAAAGVSRPTGTRIRKTHGYDHQTVEEFEAVWSRYPKAGRVRGRKGHALNVFAFARKRVSLDTIMAGLERSLSGQDSFGHWPALSKWLKDERWTDFEPDDA